MQLAIEEARTGIQNDHGGPFGSVIVKDGEVISTGHNMVLLNNDPTAHGEISAIRAAGRKLGTFDLSGCTIYTTGEPCHMCLCACMWANIDKIYYGCTIEDNGLIGFRDDKFMFCLRPITPHKFSSQSFGKLIFCRTFFFKFSNVIFTVL